MQDFDGFNTVLARKLKSLKKDLGVLSIRQGYKGTGTRAYRRQMWVYMPPDAQPIDLWLEGGFVALGGCCHTNYGRVNVGERTPEQVYQEIVEMLRPLAKV
jgi:hypothetical protein